MQRTNVEVKMSFAGMNQWIGLRTQAPILRIVMESYSQPIAMTPAEARDLAALLNTAADSLDRHAAAEKAR